MIRVSLIALLIACGSFNAVAEEPPLPKGARLRLGTEHFRLRSADRWSSVVIAPDGKGLIVPRTFGGFEVHEFGSGRAVKKIELPDLSASSIREAIAISADGKRIVTDQHITFRVWDCETGKELFSVKNVGYMIAALSADGSTLAVLDASKVPVRATMYDAATGKGGKEFATTLDSGSKLFLSADGKTLAITGRQKLDSVVQLWDTGAGKELALIRSTRELGTPGPVAFSPDGKTVAVGYYNSKCVLYDASTGKATSTLTVQGDYIDRLAFSPDGKGLVAFLSDESVQWLNVETGKTVSLTKCPVPVTELFGQAIVFTAPDKAVVWAIRDKAAFAWEVPSGKALTPVEGHCSGASSVVFSADGKEIITAGPDCRVLRWDAATGKQLGVIAMKPSPKSTSRPQLVLSANAQRGFTFEAVYDLQSGNELAAWHDAKLITYASNISPSADGKHVASIVPPRFGKTDTRCVVYSATGRSELDVVLPNVSEGALNTCATLSADGGRVVTVVMKPYAKDKPYEAVFRAWDVATAKKLCEVTLNDVRGEPRSAVMSPDGKTAYLGTIRGGVVAVDVETGKVGRTFGDGPDRFTQFPLLSQDGKRLAVSEITNRKMAGQLHHLRIYDTTNGDLLNTFEVYNMPAAFSPDGNTLATYNGYTVLLWDLTKNEKK